MKPKTPKHALLLFVGGLALASAFPQPLAYAVRRATDAEMDSMAKPLEEYLEDVVRHFEAVDGIILRRGQIDYGDVVQRLERRRDAAEGSAEAAALSYLIARAGYWQAFHSFKTTRNRAVFEEARPRVVSEHLRAFKTLEALPPEMEPAARLARRISESLVSLLATNIWGASLPDEAKAEVVEAFVDKVEGRKGLLAPGTATARTARMYRNLGIGHRLEESLLGELPEEYGELVERLRKAERVALPERLAPLVAMLEKDHADALAEDADALALAARISQANGEAERAYAFWVRACGLDPRRHLQAYALSLAAGIHAPEAASSLHLDPFIANAEPETAQGPDKRRTRSGAYLQAAAALEAAGQWQACLDLAERFEADDSFGKEREDKAWMSYRKARSHAKLGDRKGAEEAFKAALAALPHHPPSLDGLREALQWALANINAIVEEKRP